MSAPIATASKIRLSASKPLAADEVPGTTYTNADIMNIMLKQSAKKREPLFETYANLASDIYCSIPASQRR